MQLHGGEHVNCRELHMLVNEYDCTKRNFHSFTVKNLSNIVLYMTAFIEIKWH